jgi:hypothetical protein
LRVRSLMPATIATIIWELRVNPFAILFKIFRPLLLLGFRLPSLPSLPAVPLPYPELHSPSTAGTEADIISQLQPAAAPSSSIALNFTLPPFRTRHLCLPTFPAP